MVTWVEQNPVMMKTSIPRHEGRSIREKYPMGQMKQSLKQSSSLQQYEQYEQYKRTAHALFRFVIITSSKRIYNRSNEYESSNENRD